MTLINPEFAGNYAGWSVDGSGGGSTTLINGGVKLSQYRCGWIIIKQTFIISGDISYSWKSGMTGSFAEHYGLNIHINGIVLPQTNRPFHVGFIGPTSNSGVSVFNLSNYIGQTAEIEIFIKEDSPLFGSADYFCSWSNHATTFLEITNLKMIGCPMFRMNMSII